MEHASSFCSFNIFWMLERRIKHSSVDVVLFAGLKLARRKMGVQTLSSVREY